MLFGLFPLYPYAIVMNFCITFTHHAIFFLFCFCSSVWNPLCIFSWVIPPQFRCYFTQKCWDSILDPGLRALITVFPLLHVPYYLYILVVLYIKYLYIYRIFILWIHYLLFIYLYNMVQATVEIRCYQCT